MNLEKQIYDSFSRNQGKMISSRRQNMANANPISNLWLASESNTLLDLMDVHVSLISRQLTVLWANNHAKALFGHGMVGKQCCEVYSCLHNDEEPNSLCLIKKGLFEDNIEEHEIRLTTDETTEKNFLGTVQVVSRDRSGAPLTIALIYKDVTECRMAKIGLEESMRKLESNLLGTVKAMSRTMETRDPYTAGHQKRTVTIARNIAKAMGLSKNQVDGIGMASAVHDFGKICVPVDILSKPGKISRKEFSLIKEHPQSGYNILKDIDFNGAPVADIVLQHHERIDGSGYPFGLVGDEILMESRVVGVADVIEAMASKRPYRKALGMKTAMKEIKMNRGKFYDPLVAEAALDLYSQAPKGLPILPEL